MRGAVGRPPHYLVKDRSIWWGLSYNGKPLALTQSCSAKAWILKGISLIQDIMDGGQLREWEDIKYRFNIPNLQKKTYTPIKKEILSCNPKELLDANGFLKKIKWIDGNLLSESTTKNVYLFMKNDSSLIARVSQCWGQINPFSNWSFFFEYMWKSKAEPKKLCFKWLLLFKRLVVGKVLSSIGLAPVCCNICNVHESFEHLFFECLYARKIWSTFWGVSMSVELY